jgi:hypothetical protein
MASRLLQVTLLGLLAAGCAAGPSPVQSWRLASWPQGLPWLVPRHGAGGFRPLVPPSPSSSPSPSPVRLDEIPHPPGPLETRVLPHLYGGLNYGTLGYGGFGYSFALTPWRPLKQIESIRTGFGPRWPIIERQ